MERERGNERERERQRDGERGRERGRERQREKEKGEEIVKGMMDRSRKSILHEKKHREMDRV